MNHNPKNQFQKGHSPTKGVFKKGHKQLNTGRTHFKKGQISLMKGKKHTEESRKKISESLKGKKAPKTAFTRERVLGEKNVNWKGGKPKCLVCKKILSIRGVKYCRKHFGQFQSGKNHPNWVNGNYKKSDRPYGDSASHYFRIEVYKRDNYRCKINNKDCKGQLEAHHILSWRDYPELRYDINNGITLCQFHHPHKWEEEKRLSPYFMELVSVSKIQN